MNWFTRSLVSHYPHALKIEEVKKWGGCSHVVDDPSLLYAIGYEHDSMGKDGYCQCEDCYRHSQELREQEKVGCEDCHMVFARKDVTSWAAYDYCPSDGDRPIYVCGRCAIASKHLQRIKDNDQARWDEFGE